ncbi:hypothetical protein TNCV_2553181 [Trichonephila clavipes]|nr:hypothetical protein TNCV_2553181 [Trichonephila clavipes]
MGREIRSASRESPPSFEDTLQILHQDALRQTSPRKDPHIVRNARVQPTASSIAIQAQLAPLLGASVSSRTLRRLLAERRFGSHSGMEPGRL